RKITPLLNRIGLGLVGHAAADSPDGRNVARRYPPPHKGIDHLDLAGRGKVGDVRYWVMVDPVAYLIVVVDPISTRLIFAGQISQILGFKHAAMDSHEIRLVPRIDDGRTCPAEGAYELAHDPFGVTILQSDDVSELPGESHGYP